MKQKIIIKLPINDQKSRSRALKTAVVTGVQELALIGAEQDQLQVIGEGIDSVTLTRLLRKKLAHADLVSVGVLGEAKKEETAEKKKEAPPPVVKNPAPPPVVENPAPPYGFPPYHIVEVRDSVNDPSCCTIM